MELIIWYFANSRACVYHITDIHIPFDITGKSRHFTHIVIIINWILTLPFGVPIRSTSCPNIYMPFVGSFFRLLPTFYSYPPPSCYFFKRPMYRHCRQYCKFTCGIFMRLHCYFCKSRTNHCQDSYLFAIKYPFK